MLNKKGDYARAETMFRETLVIQEHALGNEHPELVQSLYNLAVVLGDLGKLAEGARLLRQSMNIEFGLCDASAFKRNREAATKAIRQAIQKNPQPAGYLMFRGFV